MNRITLVLPFALPPPELAPDLLRAMATPALASLISRTGHSQHHAFDNATRVLPHEAWLAHALGLGAAPDTPDAAAAFGAASLRGFGQAAPGHWFLMHPVHVQIARNHLVMGEQRRLPLDDSEARALFAAALPYFEDAGKELRYGDAHTWFLRADDWAGLATASPDAASAQNLTAYMPEGEAARACRKLQNEIQMLWYDHPVNEAREALRQQPINSFWIWGGAESGVEQPPEQQRALLTGACPAWLAALAAPARRNASLAEALAMAAEPSHTDGALVVRGDLVETGLAGDWSEWLMHMQRLEQDWFAPLLAALKDGRLGQLTLVLNHRDAWAEFVSSRGAQRKFWRKPALQHLKR